MPRLPLSLFWRARRVSPGAALLLPVCRDLASALLEFSWIKQHVESESHGLNTSRVTSRVDARVLHLCRRRGRGEPLQYVLGTQPFGPLDLLCRRGVLIPRPEPEAYSMYLAEKLIKEAKDYKTAVKPSITILDACTGTGCIALLQYAQLRRRVGVHVVGVDVASEAVKLAQDNATRNGLSVGHEKDERKSLSFVQCNLFSDDWLSHPAVQRLAKEGDEKGLDVLVSNPPYISADGFAHDTARSVRIFEPKLAQVPLKGGEDVFYHRLLELAAQLDARIVLCEVGDLAQAERVVAAALTSHEKLLEVEIWADSPDIPAPEERSVVVQGRRIPICGSGRGRSVFLRRR